MKKSLVAFILTLTLILGVLSAPAMAFTAMIGTKAIIRKITFIQELGIG